MSWYEKVPKDFHENLEYRKKLREWAGKDVGRQQTLLRVCEAEPLYFINAFCWLYEPRPRKGVNGKPLPMVMPFITWPHQDPAIMTIEDGLGFKDMGAEKSRGEGASWISLMIILRRFLFQAYSAFGLVSRNELAVDNPDDPDSLMWKLDWELTKLPKWMVPPTDRNQTRHILKNKANGATIVGYSATGDVASGGRKTAFLMDELAKFPPGQDEAAMASTQHVTDSRLVISTPKGPENEYAKLMHKDSTMVKIILDWKDNPTKNRGLFRVVNGDPVPIDSVNNPLPDEYVAGWPEMRRRLLLRGYTLDGTLRSPWYDLQCMRPAASPKSIAQELDRDYGGSMSRFFNAANIDRLLIGDEATARLPRYVGDLAFDLENYQPRWIANGNGHLRIWCPLDAADRPPGDCSYIVSGDVAMGTGGDNSSNSVLSVVVRETGVKVAEFASPNTSPESLANYAVALCRFFRGKDEEAFLIWEANGPGGQFRVRIVETGFRNFYVRTVLEEVSKSKTKKLGWWSSKKSKQELLGAYNYALMQGEFINPSAEALSECKQYQNGKGGAVTHVAADAAVDPSGAGENHGDRVIADALGHWARVETGAVAAQQKREIEHTPEAPKGSYAERRAQFVSTSKKSTNW